jgi:hypothetical protein
MAPKFGWVEGRPSGGPTAAQSPAPVLQGLGGANQGVWRTAAGDDSKFSARTRPPFERFANHVAS